MENMLLSSASNGIISLKKCAVPYTLRISNARCLDSRIVSGFKGYRVSSQSGFVGDAGLRHSLQVGGWYDPVLKKNSLSVSAHGEESASNDVQVEGKDVEGVKDTDIVHEATTWNGDQKEFENSDTEPFDSLRNSVEELQREVDKAKESLAEVSEAIREEDNVSQATQNVSIEEPRKGAKIHDFCLGIPYGGLLVGGGLVGFLVSGSKASVLFGLLLGGAVLGLSITSLKVWRQEKSCTPFILGQAALSFILLVRQLQEFSLTKKIFPTGYVAVISASMLCFYSYVYAAGGNPPSKKLRVSSTS